MMPLIYADSGTTVTIKKITGKTEVKQFLEKLGFTVGCDVTVVSSAGGNLIVQMKESRVALSRETAGKIMV